MLYIITTSELSKVKKINDIESRFDVLVNSGVQFEDSIYTSIMKSIDNVTERDGTVIKTPFGKTVINNLSSGCKTVILAVYYRQQDVYVCIDECGDNALKVLFKLSDKMDLKTYINREIALLDSNIKCIINNEFVTDGYNIYRKLVDLNGYNQH